MTVQHIAVIMDGNGRWAQQRGLARTKGHQEGLEAARRIVKAASDLHIPYITLYVFSTENWKRTEEEVGFLMGLIQKHLRAEFAFYAANSIKVRHIGRDEIIRAIKKLESRQLAALTESDFDSMLDTAGVPPVDLVIRTGGEKRLSNFLLWQTAYAEWYSTDILWPDFTPAHFMEALDNYAQRTRRFGGIV